MSQEPRRRLLKGLAVTLPAAWSAPVVESIILPAHAQTSPAGCGAPEGCYRGTGDAEGLSIFWPGGAGPDTATVFESPNCSGDVLGMGDAVVAESPEAAAEALGCTGENQELLENPTDPPPGDGCIFYSCIAEA